MMFAKYGSDVEGYNNLSCHKKNIVNIVIYRERYQISTETNHYANIDSFIYLIYLKSNSRLSSPAPPPSSILWF